MKYTIWAWLLVVIYTGGWSTSDKENPPGGITHIVFERWGDCIQAKKDITTFRVSTRGCFEYKGIVR